MHHQSIDSYASWLVNSPKLQEGNLRCINPAAPSDSRVEWLFQTIDGIIPILGRLFPKIEAYYLLEEGSECNAHVREVAGGSARIVVTDHCGQFFLNWARELHLNLFKVIDAPLERTLVQMWAVPRNLTNLQIATSMGADVYSVCALSCLLAHELGHVHENHFDPKFYSQAQKDGRWALIFHGREFAADYWSVWAAADILRPFIDIALKGASNADEALACKRLLSTLAMAAFACVEPLLLSEAWTAADPADHEDTHPIASARLMNAAVAMTDWWVDRAGESDTNLAASVCVKALQRVLALSQDVTRDGLGWSEAELLEVLLQRHDEAKNYMNLVKQVYPQVV